MSAALRKAIKLREWTRLAIKSDDAVGDRSMRETIRLNDLADVALAQLNDTEMSAYIHWAKGDYPTLLDMFKDAIKEARQKWEQA